VRHKRRPTLLGFLGVLGSAFALVVVPSAQAANIVPNSGFENDCSGIPCQWNPSSSGALTRDTSVHLTGSASLRLAGTLNGSTADTVSDCVAITPGTIYYMSVWYRTTGPVSPTNPVTSITFSAAYWSGANCTGSNGNPGAAKTLSPNTDGSWHRITGSTTATTNPPFDAHSAQLVISFSCLQACSDTNVVNYDDAVMDTTPSAVSVDGFRAARSREAVMLRWRTGTEADLLGFQVYRSRGHSWRRITHALIAAKGSVSGASYRYLDKTARRGVAYRYRIKALNRDGTASWFGPVRST
jgi:hypothetical protein